jgi:aryl-alcohol dehydrogenase-like predicted oxidoreductase
MEMMRDLGSSRVSVGSIGFGAWAIGGSSYGDVSEADAEATVETYLDLGGTFIDTARNYRKSEEILGRVISRRGDREKIFLATKTSKTSTVEELPLIREQVEMSLRLLQTDVIDLYFIHAPPEDPDLMERVLQEFESLKAEGKIRYIGASIKGPDVTQQTVALCKQYVDTGRIHAIQLIYSILRQLNRESIDYARKHGVGIVARTVLESGFLTGKFSRGSQFQDHRRRWNAGADELLETVDSLKSWAVPPSYQSLAQVALRFALVPPGVSTIIPGGKNASQVRANMSIADLPDLPEDLLDRFRSELGDFTPRANTSR